MVIYGRGRLLAGMRSAGPHAGLHAGRMAAGLAASGRSLSRDPFSGFRPFGDDVVKSALFMLGMTSAAVLLVDLLWLKAYRRAADAGAAGVHA